MYVKQNIVLKPLLLQSLSVIVIAITTMTTIVIC